MIRSLLERTLARRAEELADWLAPHLPAPISSTGPRAGTGHNAVALRRRRGGLFVNLDVADLHVVGERPARYDGAHMPFADNSFAAGLLIFVLQYAPDPVPLLREARRVCAGPVLVVQSTYSGQLAGAALRLHDLAWGPLAYGVGQAAGLVPPGRAPLYARFLAPRPSFQRTCALAGLRARLARSAPWPLLAVQCDLYVLEPMPTRSAH